MGKHLLMRPQVEFRADVDGRLYWEFKQALRHLLNNSPIVHTWTFLNESKTETDDCDACLGPDLTEES